MAILTGQIIDGGVGYLNAVYQSGGVWYKAVSPNFPEGIYVGDNTVNTSGFTELIEEKTIKFRHDPKYISPTSNDTAFDFDGTDIEIITPLKDSVENLNLLTEGIGDYIIIQNTTASPIQVNINKLGGVEWSEDNFIWNSPSAETNVPISANDSIFRYYRHDKDVQEISLPSIITFSEALDVLLGVDLKPEFNFDSTYVNQESSELTLTILNTKSTVLTIDDITPPTGFTKSTAEPGTIAGSSSGTVGFKFTPTTVGLLSDDFTIDFDTTFSQDISFSATSLALLTADPLALNFGNLLININSSPQTFEIENVNATSESITITAPTGFTIREQYTGSYVSSLVTTVDALSTKTFEVRAYSPIPGSVVETLDIEFDSINIGVELYVIFLDDSEIDVLATITTNKDVIDFKKIKKDSERINNFTITVDGSSETLTIRAPEGYYLIDPISGDRVKTLEIQDGDVLIQNTGDAITQNDGFGIAIVTSHGSFLLTDENELLITDTNEEIEIIE